MYNVTKEEVFLLFTLVLATLIGYIVFIFTGSLLYGLRVGLFVLLFLVGGKFYVAMTYGEKVLGSIAMAFAIFIVIEMVYGLSAGIVVFLSLLTCCFALIYFRS